jgi:hypothetical protein
MWSYGQLMFILGKDGRSVSNLFKSRKLKINLLYPLLLILLAFLVYGAFADIVNITPVNGTNMTVGAFNITLNFTIGGDTTDAKDLYIFAGNVTSPESRDGMVYKALNQANGTAVAYNFTSIPINSSYHKESLIMLLHMDNRSEYGENDTLVYNFVGGRFNGTLIGTPTWNSSIDDCKFGGCFEFQESEGFSFTHASTDNLRNMTISTWYKQTGSFTFNDWFVSKGAGDGGGNWQYGMNTDTGNIIFTTDWSGGDPTATWNSMVVSGELAHFVFTWDGTNAASTGMKLYKNGVLQTQSSNTDAGTPKTNAGAVLTVGGAHGMMDDFAMWNKTLNATEIKDLYRLNANDYYWYVNATNITGGDSSLSDIRCLSSDGGCPVGGDSIAPNITSLTELPDPVAIGAIIKLNATIIDDDGEGLDTASIRVQVTYPNGTLTNYTASNSTDAPQNFTNFTISTLSNGSHTVKWFANDTDGNVNSTETSSFYVAYPPEATLDLPANKTQYYNDTFNITLNATIVDHDLNTTDIFLFSGNTTTPETRDGLVYKSLSNANGTKVGYNITSLPVNSSSDGLVGLWHMDNRSEYGENKTHVFDFSSIGNNGTVNPGVTWNGTEDSCKFGGCFDFDGSSGYIDMGNPADNSLDFETGNFTISAWVRPDSAGDTTDWIVMKRNSNPFYGIVTIATNAFRFWISDAEADRIEANSDNNKFTPGGAWVHVVGVRDSQTTAKLYINGVLNGSGTNVDFGNVSNSGSFYIGRQDTAEEFDGMIDDVAVWNRTFSNVEVLDLYRLGAANYTWYVNTSDGDFTNQSEIRTFEVFLQPNPNVAPVVINISISPNSPNTTDQLNCSYNITDSDIQTALSVNITWKNGSTIYSSVNHSASSGVLNSTLLASGIQAKGETWNCTATAYDGALTGLNSTTVTAVNTAPSQVTLLNPDDDADVTNRTIQLNWSAATDADGDPINYTLNISCIGGCAGDNRRVNRTAVNYPIATQLQFFDDDGYYYEWVVQAYDGTDYGAASSVWALNISALVDISLDSATILFTTLLEGANNDTTNDKPSPFILNNDGNAMIDINLTGESLFNVVTPPTYHFQYKVDNSSGEEGAFNWVNSQTTYQNVSTSATKLFEDLNHSAGKNSAEIDINITVPTNEPAGNKTAQLTFTGYYVGVGG